MKTLIFARHGDADPLFGDLTDEGLRQAQSLAVQLKERFSGVRVGVVSSPELRAKATAGQIASAMSLGDAIQTIKGLSEGGWRAGYGQGVGVFLPKELDVAVCVSHEPTILAHLRSVANQDLMSVKNAEAFIIEADGEDWSHLAGAGLVGRIEPNLS